MKEEIGKDFTSGFIEDELVSFARDKVGGELVTRLGPSF